MIRLCIENGLPEPAFGYRDGFVTTVWRPNSENPNGNGEMPGKKLSKTEAKVVQLMRDNRTVTLPEIAAAIGLHSFSL